MNVDGNTGAAVELVIKYDIYPLLLNCLIEGYRRNLSCFAHSFPSTNYNDQIFFFGGTSLKILLL